MGMTQGEFASALGVKATTYSSWESDRNQVRDQKGIAKRLKMLANVPMWWFLDAEPPSGPDGPDGDGVRPKGFEPLTFWSGAGADRTCTIVPLRPAKDTGFEPVPEQIPA
ncbi:transcriptional repressor [Gordonia phage UmaThurman]|uniref:transcriptional repressor n=1 Tax=Gordonia phage UmaThurman TaxID=1821563 RepID=UPI00078C17EE|nr:transcriptional repressor [Gordonia phage UmaThurman]AMS03936.1 immunity repressor [Gordonia phage UmaThurman]